MFLFEPDASLLAALARTHGCVRVMIDALAFPRMPREEVHACLARLQAGGWVQVEGDVMWVTGLGLKKGLTLVRDAPRSPGGERMRAYGLFEVDAETGRTVRFQPDRYPPGLRMPMENLSRAINHLRARLDGPRARLIHALPLER